MVRHSMVRTMVPSRLMMNANINPPAVRVGVSYRQPSPGSAAPGNSHEVERELGNRKDTGSLLILIGEGRDAPLHDSA